MEEEVTSLKLLMTAVAGMAGVIGMFWRQDRVNFQDMKNRCAQAEKDRDDLYKENARLRFENEMLQKRLEKNNG